MGWVGPERFPAEVMAPGYCPEPPESGSTQLGPPASPCASWRPPHTPLPSPAHSGVQPLLHLDVLCPLVVPCLFRTYAFPQWHRGLRIPGCLQQQGFDPWPRNFPRPQMQPKNKTKHLPWSSA